MIELYAAAKNLSRNKRVRGTNHVYYGPEGMWLGKMGSVVCLHMRSPLFVLVILGGVMPALWPQTASDADYSGMYSFLREGEFLQITIEDESKISGFVSRFGDLESDKGTFLDQFIKSGEFKGGKLTFITETVHGTWFTFEGAPARGSGRDSGEEGFYVLRGTLKRFNTDAEKKTTSQERKVEFKSFPRDKSSQ